LQAQSPEMEIRARLLAPISTETSSKGDKISAQVPAPDQYKGCHSRGRGSRIEGRGKDQEY
jgi:hypothetical protein